MDHYNILYEPWIEVEKPDKTTEKVGLIECLKKADQYRRIRMHECKTHMDEFAVYRFIEAFLCAAYQPTEDTILEIWEDEHFDMGIIQKYIEHCNKDGERFDMFGDNPFMQVPKGQESLLKDIFPISKLDATMRIGTEESFFGYQPGRKLQDTYNMSMPQFIGSLLRNSFCAASIGSAGVSSLVVKGQPPIMFVVELDNLFQTLVANMPIMQERLYGIALPAWEQDEYLRDLSEITKSRCGYLEFAFYQTKGILITDMNEDNVVKTYASEMKFSKNNKPKEYNKNAAVIEPHAIKINIDKTESDRGLLVTSLDVIKTDIIQSEWLSLFCFIAQDHKVFQSLNAIKNIKAINDTFNNRIKKVTLRAYLLAVKTNNNQLTANRMFFANDDVPEELFENRNNLVVAEEICEEIRELGKSIRRALRYAEAESGTNKDMRSVKVDYIQKSTVADVGAGVFYRKTKDIFFKDIIPKICLCKTEEEYEAYKKNEKKRLWKCAKDTYWDTLLSKESLLVKEKYSHWIKGVKKKGTDNGKKVE